MAASRAKDHVLVTRHDKIGDFVLTFPLLWGIKQASPTTKISVLVARVNEGLARQLPFVDDVLVYEKGVRGFLTTLKRLRVSGVRASISCFIDLRLGALLCLAGISLRTGPATKIAQVFFNQRLIQRRSRVEKPEWAYNLDLGRVLFPGLPTAFNRPIIRVPTGGLCSPESQEHLEQTDNKKRVVFHPGFGGSSDGNLSLPNYLRLARIASGIPGVRVTFTFGPDDTEAMEWIRHHLDFQADLMPSSMSLWEFCGFLQSCSLFVSTSTGPMHLAGAVNTRTLSFFGSSVFASCRRWQPLNMQDRQANFMLDGPPSEATFTQIVDALRAALK